MKKTVVLISGMLFLAVTLPACGGHEEPSTTTEQNETTAEKYACPMHCEGDKTYDSAGSCAVCGMDLEKIEE